MDIADELIRTRTERDTYKGKLEAIKKELQEAKVTMHKCLRQSGFIERENLFLNVELDAKTAQLENLAGLVEPQISQT